MIECILSWICLVMSFTTENTDYIIASGIFAIAAQIAILHYKRK